MCVRCACGAHAVHMWRLLCAALLRHPLHRRRLLGRASRREPRRRPAPRPRPLLLVVLVLLLGVRVVPPLGTPRGGGRLLPLGYSRPLLDRRRSGGGWRLGGRVRRARCRDGASPASTGGSALVRHRIPHLVRMQCVCSARAVHMQCTGPCKVPCTCGAHAVHMRCAVRCILRTHSGISLPSPSSLGSSSLEGAAPASAVAAALPTRPCAARVVSAPACQCASSPSAALPPRVRPPTPAPSSASPRVSCVPCASGGMMAATGGGAAPRCLPRRSASLTAMPSSRSSLGTYVMSRKRSPGVSQTWLRRGANV